MSNRILCFYHSADLDGHCSGALVKMAYPECELHPIDYGDKFPWDLVRLDSLAEIGRIFMVDFSLQPFEEMVKLQQLTDNKLIWIDHHKSAIEAHKEWNNRHPAYLSICGIREVGAGACELVWRYLRKRLHPLLQGLPEGPPLFVRLLAEYDVWDHFDPRTLPFQYGVRLHDTAPENQDFWRSLFYQSICERIINEGEVVLKYIERDNKKYAQATWFPVYFNNLKCIAINRAFGNTKLFNSVDTGQYDAMIAFAYQKDKWVVYLYSAKPEVDVSEIAKEYGGGGHKAAAGFVCQELPFPLK